MRNTGLSRQTKVHWAASTIFDSLSGYRDFSASYVGHELFCVENQVKIIIVKTDIINGLIRLFGDEMG